MWNLQTKTCGWRLLPGSVLHVPCGWCVERPVVGLMMGVFGTLLGPERTRECLSLGSISPG
jgi:hypothetical protein